MSARDAIYLDWNAGAPLHPESVKALSGLLESRVALTGNPSSIHSYGRRVKCILSDARESISWSLGNGIRPEQIFFTPSGTEANQIIIRSVLESAIAAKGESGKNHVHWITTGVEHASTLRMIEWAKTLGVSVSLLPVTKDGRPDISVLPEMLMDETALISVIWVNNETGVISDVNSLFKVASKKNIFLHLDGAQAWGKQPLSLDPGMALAVSLSGCKIGALSGTGALWITDSAREKIRETDFRVGTENVLGIATLGAVARVLNPEAWAKKVRPIMDYLEDAVCRNIDGVIINGSANDRVANTSNFTFDGIEGEGLVMALDLAGFSVSAGSACLSGKTDPSHVLLAMGRTRAQAKASIRVSIGESTRLDCIEEFLNVLYVTVKHLRETQTRWRKMGCAP
ncbi:MAG: cysteine desulfurase family protein [Bdellovibrionota bacterium]